MRRVSSSMLYFVRTLLCSVACTIEAGGQREEECPGQSSEVFAGAVSCDACPRSGFTVLWVHFTHRHAHHSTNRFGPASSPLQREANGPALRSTTATPLSSSAPLPAPAASPWPGGCNAPHSKNACYKTNADSIHAYPIGYTLPKAGIASLPPPTPTPPR